MKKNIRNYLTIACGVYSISVIMLMIIYPDHFKNNLETQFLFLMVALTLGIFTLRFINFIARNQA